MRQRVPLRRYTALKAKTRLKPISSRQREREADLKRRKIARIVASLEQNSSVACEGCGMLFYTLSEAMSGLHGHHKKTRHHCDDSNENIALLCSGFGSQWCHEKAHGIEVKT